MAEEKRQALHHPGDPGGLVDGLVSIALASYLTALGFSPFEVGAIVTGTLLGSATVTLGVGLIRTMVYTHLPSNVLLILAALMPSAPLAIACLLLRTAVSQMDVPARQAFVMAVVPPEERAAASTVTNVPRSLSAGLAPLLAGAPWRRRPSDGRS